MAIVTTTVGADGVALIAIDDPSRPANVTSPELTAEFLGAVDRVANDPAIVGAVIASGKPARFIAGGDIKDFVGAWERRMSFDEAFELSHRWNRDMRRIERCGKPFAAAINGAALGGGFEIALLCHHRVLLDEPHAVVGLVEVGIGLLPAGGGSQRLPRLVGIDAALRMMVDARRFAPREALEAGLVDAVVPAERLVLVARDWVRSHPHARQPWEQRADAAPDIAQIDTLRVRWRRELDERFGGRYPAPLALLQAVMDGAPRPLDEGLRIESQCFAPLLTGVVARNLMRTGFVYRQQADKKARQARARASDAASSIPVHEAASRPPPERGACLWLWPSAAQPQLAEIAVALDAPAECIDAALAQAAVLAVTPVVLPAGRPSFVARLRKQHGDLSAMSAEARRALADGDIACAADADLASVLGGGCPAWSGGVISVEDMETNT